MKIFLCGFHRVGLDVLARIVSRSDLSDVAVFTHDAPSHVPDLYDFAKSKEIWVTKGDVSSVEWPFQPDMISSVYYRHIVKQHVIQSVNGKIFNLHPSLLPRHRGCSSVTWAIIEGDETTGITFHYIDSGVDTGNIILQGTTQISSTETQASLYTRCMLLGARFWPAAFELVKAGFLGLPQEGQSSFHRRGVPFDRQINDTWSDEKIDRFIRAMLFEPYPCAVYQDREVRSFSDFLKLRKNPA